MSNKLFAYTSIGLLIAAPFIMGVLALTGVTAVAGFSVVIISIAIALFFTQFERSRPLPEQLMPIVVLVALGVAGRIIFAAVPNVKPVTAIVIIAGIAFGKEAGFMTGSLTALASNMFFGQGPWTPWQMYAWGLIGYIAGALFSGDIQKRRWVVYLYGFVASLGFGFILDTWHVLVYVSPLNLGSALVGYGAGLPLTIIHAVSTVLFLVPTLEPWGIRLARIRTKFGLHRGD